MTPLDSVGLAASTVQFVDFGIRLVSKSSEIARSANGRLLEHGDLYAVSTDLSHLARRLVESKALLSVHTSLTEDDRALITLSEGCLDVSGELHQALEKLRCSRPWSTWKSVRKALKTIWSKEKVNALQQRLSLYKSQLDSRTLAGVATRVDRNATQQSEGFQQLEETICSVEQNLELATTKIEEHLTVTIISSNGETQKEIQGLRGQVERLTEVEELAHIENLSLNNEVQKAISSSEANIRCEQKELSAELSRQLQSAEEQISQLRHEMSSLEAKIAETIKETFRSNGKGQNKQRKSVNVHVNAVYRMWVAKDIILQELLIFINGVKKLLSREWVSIKQIAWKLVPYESPNKPISPSNIVGSEAIPLPEAGISVFLLFKAISDANIVWFERDTRWHPYVDEQIDSTRPMRTFAPLAGREDYRCRSYGPSREPYKTMMTPLIFAMFSLHYNHTVAHGPIEMANRAQIINYLLEAGANPDVPDGKGYSARKHAVNLKIPQIFLHFGSRCLVDEEFCLAQEPGNDAVRTDESTAPPVLVSMESHHWADSALPAFELLASGAHVEKSPARETSEHSTASDVTDSLLDKYH